MVAAAFLGCSREPSDPVLATFAQGEVRQSDLDTWRSFLNPKGSSENRRLDFDSLERHVIMRTLAAEAIAAGLEEDPAIRLRVRQAVDERLANALHHEVMESIEVPDAEVSEYLRRHREELAKPERRTVSLIFRRTGSGDRESARAELAAARRRWLAGEDFATLASEISDSPSRHQGGHLGTVKEGQLPEALDRVLFALEEGDVSEVVETGAGVALLRSDRVLPAYTMDDEEARQRIERSLRRPLFEKAWQEIVERVTAGRFRHDVPALLDPATPPDVVISRFGEETLSRGEAELLVASDPDADRSGREGGTVAETLDRFAVNALLAAEARRRGLHEEPECARELGWIRLEQLSRVMLKRKVDAMMPEAGEGDLRQAYEERREAYRLPDRYLLHVLRRPYSPEAPGPVYRDLVAIGEAVRTGSASFEAAAGEETGPTWRLRSEVAGWGPTLLRTISDLQPGEVTGPIQMDGELWVVQLVERERGRLQDFEAVRDRVTAAFERGHRLRLIEQVLQWTLAGAELERLSDEAPQKETGEG